MPIVQEEKIETRLPAPAVRRSSGLETIGLLVEAMRPKQWVKNLIAYAPLIFSCNMTHPPLLLSATLCVVAFCLVSGGVYIFNDALDEEADRKHPSKRLRPIASGRLDKTLALTFGAAVALSGLILSFLVRPSFCLVVAGYLTLSVLYCLVLKQIVIIDAFAISAGFVLRAVGGAIAIAVPSSGWFLVCTSLGALFLALEKRRQEMRILGDSFADHRKALTGYSMRLLERMENILVPSLLTSYAFYSFMSFHGQWMMLTVPFVFYGVMRYEYLCAQSSATAQPEDVFWKDRPIQVAILCWLATCALVIHGVPQWMFTGLR